MRDVSEKWMDTKKGYSVDGIVGRTSAERPKAELAPVALATTAASKKQLRPVVLTVVLVAFGLVGLMVVGAAWFMRVHQTPHAAVSQLSNAAPKAAAAPVDQQLSSHMMFVGDVFWGRAIQTAAERKGQGVDSIFSGLTAADKQGFDAWVGDMECPVTNRDIPYRTQVDDLIFNCQPKYTAAAAKWFDVMTLANNHTANNGGVWGLEQTRNNLEAAGIQYFGNYDMTQTNDICEVIAMPAHGNDAMQKFAMPVALCGFDYVGNVAATDEQMAQMKRYAAVMPVIAMPHMGTEYLPTAEAAKVAVYRRLLDSGADMVVGAHPHVVQNTEVYKGRLIAYSVGNFLFDQQILGKDTVRTLGVGADLTVKDNKAVEVYKTVAPTCKAFKDDCLAKLEQGIAKRPTIAVTYDFQCFDESSGTPKKASDQVCSEIKQRATIDGLSGLVSSW